MDCNYDNCGFQVIISFKMKAIRALLLLATVMALRNVVMEGVFDG